MFDLGQLIFVSPAILLSIIATILVKTRFARYSRVSAASGMTGAQAAQRLLDIQGIREVTVEQVGGFLSDHYDPRTRTLRLSPGVYSSPSLAAVGVACHEAGHAMQHAQHYAPLAVRSVLVPLTQIGTFAPYVLFFLGAIMNSMHLILLGIYLFGFVVLFSVVTLPVEWDASRRAKALMVSAGVVSPMESEDAAKVLNAAFLTYVSAAFMAVLQLLYFLMRFGLLGRRDD